MKKEMIKVSIAVHPIQAGLIRGLESGAINLSIDSLRDIAKKCGQEKAPSPQQIVHHMKQLLKLGILQYINGQYVYLKEKTS